MTGRCQTDKMMVMCVCRMRNSRAFTEKVSRRADSYDLAPEEYV